MKEAEANPTEKRTRSPDEDEHVEEPTPKKYKHVTTADDVEEELERRAKRELERKNREHRKLRKLGKEDRKSRGLHPTPVKKPTDEERRHRHDLVVGDPFTTVLKLSDERLEAYGMEHISKLKKYATYKLDKMKDGNKHDKKTNKKNSFDKNLALSCINKNNPLSSKKSKHDNNAKKNKQDNSKQNNTNKNKLSQAGASNGVSKQKHNSPNKHK